MSFNNEPDQLDQLNNNVSHIDLNQFKCKTKTKLSDTVQTRSGPKTQTKPTSTVPNLVSVFRQKSTQWQVPIESAEFAARMDQEDPMRSFRQLFSFPKKQSLPNIDPSYVKNDDEDCIYLCGQSLGLKPKALDGNVQKVLDSWSARGVHSHFHGYLPAALSDLPPKKPMAKMVGAKEHEVALLNALTVNLHLLLATFYRPDAKRYKLIIEEHAFPSDTYVAKSQLRSHGISPEDGLIMLKPRKGESLLNEEDILKVFEEHGDQVKVALLPAVQYYTGQLLNVEKLTKAAQAKGIIVGVDLAHAVGNVPVYLDKWNVDFAAWCTYKYVNSGAGGIGGIYINERFLSTVNAETFPMYQGWWGNNIKTKFMMKEDFDPANGADMFKLSNPSPVLNAMLMTSLEIFNQTSIEELRQKQYLLTGYLEFMIKSYFPQKSTRKNTSEKVCNKDDFLIPSIEIITPSNPEQRGAQLSLMFSVPLSIIHEQFQKRGIVCDIRMPSVMRVAPTPLYNSFTDVYRFITTLYNIFETMDSLAANTGHKDLETLMDESSDFTNIDDDNRSHSSISTDSDKDSVAGSNTL